VAACFSTAIMEGRSAAAAGRMENVMKQFRVSSFWFPVAALRKRLKANG
jgi:hypothetical protein